MHQFDIVIDTTRRIALVLARGLALESHDTVLFKAASILARSVLTKSVIAAFVIANTVITNKRRKQPSGTAYLHLLRILSRHILI